MIKEAGAGSLPRAQEHCHHGAKMPAVSPTHALSSAMGASAHTLDTWEIPQFPVYSTVKHSGRLYPKFFWVCVCVYPIWNPPHLPPAQLPSCPALFFGVANHDRHAHPGTDTLITLYATLGSKVLAATAAAAAAAAASKPCIRDQ